MSILFLGLMTLSTLIASSSFGLSAAVNLILTLVGSALVVLMFTPQFLQIFKTKNTIGLNKPMFSLQMGVGLLYAIQSIILAVFENNAGEILKFILLCFLNFYVLACSCYMIVTKVKNELESKKVSMTELDYYKNHIEPSLKK